MEEIKDLILKKNDGELYGYIVGDVQKLPPAGDGEDRAQINYKVKSEVPSVIRKTRHVFIKTLNRYPSTRVSSGLVL